MKTLTARSITDSQIIALRTDAAGAGDFDQIAICDKALARRGGRGECARAINSAYHATHDGNPTAMDYD